MSDDIPDLGGTPEHIAFRLMEMIIATDSSQANSAANILGMYARCLRIVRNPEATLRSAEAPATPEEDAPWSAWPEPSVSDAWQLAIRKLRQAD